MDISEVLGAIKDDGLTAIKCEFQSLLGAAKNDAVDYIRNVASQIEMALCYKAQGSLTQEDVTTLLIKLQTVAKIHANSMDIAAQARIQKTVFRLFDIALGTLVKAIIPFTGTHI